jgi:hypothetical protein
MELMLNDAQRDSDREIRCALTPNNNGKQPRPQSKTVSTCQKPSRSRSCEVDLKKRDPLKIIAKLNQDSVPWIPGSEAAVAWWCPALAESEPEYRYARSPESGTERTAQRHASIVTKVKPQYRFCLK